MGLEVFKDKSARSYENTFFREFAKNIKILFDRYSYEGQLIGFSQCKYNDKLEPDAILITTSVIFIIDFKNYGGKIILPHVKNFETGIWRNQKSNKKIVDIKGGSFINPFSQLQTQKNKFTEILRKYILDELPAGNKIVPSKTVTMVCFQKPIEFTGTIPTYLEKFFSIIGSNSYLEKIRDFIDISMGVKITKSAYPLFNKAFIADSFDLKEPYLKIPKKNNVDEDLDHIGEADKEKKGKKELIPLEPDFLFNVSELAHCFLEVNYKYYAVWQKYYVNLLTPFKPCIPILKGKVVNNFLDIIIQSQKVNTSHDFTCDLKKTFINYPLEYIALLSDEKKSKDFFKIVKEQYNNLVSVVEKDFKKKNIGIDINSVYLEPSFINKEIGIHGRLDLLYVGEDRLRLVELKAGKEPFPTTKKTKINQDHVKQGQMYSLLLDKVKIFDHLDKRDIVAILYSSVNRKDVLRKGEEHSNFRWVSFDLKSKMIIKDSDEVNVINYKDEIIHLRNLVMSKYKEVINSNDDIAIDDFISSLRFKNTGINLGGNDRLDWLKFNYDMLEENVGSLSKVSKSYFCAFFRYILQEQYIGKVGDGRFDFGQSGGWKENLLSTMSDKIIGLEISNAQDVNIDETSYDIKLNMNKDVNGQWLDFRVGDPCLLFNQKDDISNVTDGQLYKCVVSDIQPGSYTLHFRHKQSDKSIKNTFKPKVSKWALVHDYLDTTNRYMLQNIGKFINIPKEKQSLVLGMKKPKFQKNDWDITWISDDKTNINADANIEIQNIISLILSSQDYFLLSGPPGTGKTNIIIKQLLKYLYHKTEEKILVLAYTNRAVNEICNAIINAIECHERQYLDSFIRLGSKHNADERYQKYILGNITEKIHLNDEIKEKREALKLILKHNRVFVSTVASYYANDILTEIVGKFDTCIVDEASHILEPMMIGLFYSANRLFFIGDEKQLPAISRQTIEQSKRFNKDVLKDIHLEDLSDSYFERMLRNAKKKNWHHCYGTLTFQARMHQEVAEFINENFYEKILNTVGLNHQKEFEIHKDMTKVFVPNILKNCSKQLLTKRVIFIDTPLYDNPSCLKTNPIQAQLTASIVQYYSNMNNEKVNETIGVITLFRSQISMIMSKLFQDSECETNNNAIKENNTKNIIIDTVERFQGSQKEVIIINLSVNTYHQLDFLKANNREMLGSNNNKMIIDKKLNVALTRAKKQVIVLGNANLLCRLPLYSKFVDFVKKRGGYIRDDAYSEYFKESTDFIDFSTAEV